MSVELGMIQRGQVAERAETAGLRLVRFLYCDNDGIVRGKASGMASLAERLDTGIGLTVAMQAFTLLDHLAPFPGMGPVGEIRLVPDPGTFVVAPYAARTGVVLVDMLTQEGEPYAADPRGFLRAMVERAAGAGLAVRAAFEPEWSLAVGEGDAAAPFDRSSCFSSHGMNTAAPVVDEVVEALEAQGLQVEQYYPELGGGQQELSIRHRSALAAADAHVLYRETVRGVAARHGLQASFAPKPWADQAGNGCHLHFSAWSLEGDSNRFYAEDGSGLSPLARSFAAGVLEHLSALLALTCASVNSYRRLQPQMWASAYRAWGPDNREAALRVPSTFGEHEEASTNIELKACDSSCNPHLALGGLIAAGLDGVGRGLDLPPPATVDPSTLSEEERTRLGAARHPESLGQAIANLERDQLLMEALGDRLGGSYLAVKRRDVEDFAGEDEAFELREHRFKF